MIMSFENSNLQPYNKGVVLKVLKVLNTSFEFLKIRFISAIKTGRSTHKRKLQDIEEVEKLRTECRLKKDGSLYTEEERVSELEAVIKKLTECYRHNIPQSGAFFRTIPEKEQHFLVSIYFNM